MNIVLPHHLEDYIKDLVRFPSHGNSLVRGAKVPELSDLLQAL